MQRRSVTFTGYLNQRNRLITLRTELKMDDSSIKDSIVLLLGDDEYGDYPKSSLWWEEQYDPLDYSICIPHGIEYDFDWGNKEGDK